MVQIDYLLYLVLCTLLGALVQHLITRPKPKKKVVKPKATRAGVVYVLGNPSFKSGIFKIGLTTRTLPKRMSELFSTSVPTPFTQCLVLRSSDCKALEAELHNRFSNRRISTRREFFKLYISDIEEILTDGNYTVEKYDPMCTLEALGEPPRPLNSA